jgi:hypothetical protein
MGQTMKYVVFEALNLCTKVRICGGESNIPISGADAGREKAMAVIEHEQDFYWLGRCSDAAARGGWNREVPK